MQLADLALDGVGRCVAQTRLGELSPKGRFAAEPQQLMSHGIAVIMDLEQQRRLAMQLFVDWDAACECGQAESLSLQQGVVEPLHQAGGDQTKRTK